MPSRESGRRAPLEAVIGLEVHVQLQSGRKLFCRCPAGDGRPPNSQTCPVCLGHPGVLPVPSREAVALAVRLGLAAGAAVHRRSAFARKHYFYPDLPKGYQITQFERPLCEGGAIPISIGGRERPIRLMRIHLEEDAGKLMHPEGEGRRSTRIDLNRCGVPLAEIVSAPDLRTAAEAGAFLAALRQLVQYLGVSGGRMEKGQLRCDANISIRPRGTGIMNPRTELKNLNSIKNVVRGLDAEIARQSAAARRGEQMRPMTMLYDQVAGGVRPMRSKEGSDDYRYFPDPDLPPLVIDDELLARERARVGELPWDVRRRFTRSYHLPEEDVERLTRTRARAAAFESLVAALRASGGPAAAAGEGREGEIKAAANWITGEQERIVKQIGPGARIPGPRRMAAFLRLVIDGDISGRSGKEVLEEMIRTGRAAGRIVAARRLALVKDEAVIGDWIHEILNRETARVRQWVAGKDALRAYFIGQVMQISKGRVCPRTLGGLLDRELKRRRSQAGR
jgi:aspartyl-tRNA(Asn)/glutamyl-tRNA(Gln) amidotransferase subunit B